MSTQGTGLNTGPLLMSDPCAALRRATRAVTHLYDLVLSPTGLKATQFVLLHAIHQRGEIAQWRLADEHGVGVDTLSRRLAVLRNDGLITFRIGVERPGEKLYRLTALGETRWRESLPAWERAQERLQKVLGIEQWNLLLKITSQVAAEARRAETARLVNTGPPKAFAASVSDGRSEA